MIILPAGMALGRPVIDTNTYTTFNPSDKATGIALSSGNLVATSTADNVGIVRAAHGKSSGKWYFEMVISTAQIGIDTIAVGLANGSHALTAALGYSTANGWAYWGRGGSGYRNGALVLADPDFAQGDVAGFAVDLDNDRLWISRNGTWLQGNPAAGTSPLSTNLTGTIYPAASPWKQSRVITARFSPSALGYSAPDGFTPGWTAT